MNAMDLNTEALEARVEAAARVLLGGGAVIYPTETFYGLGAALGVPAGVERIAGLKQRSAPKPVPVIAADEASARRLWRALPEVTERLVERLIARFWPGPLTIVLPASALVPASVAPFGEVGVRVSPHPVARALAQAAGPLVATSANLAGQGEKTLVAELDRAVVERVDAVLDAGATPGGKPSTVLRLTGGAAVLLREGALARSLVEEALGRPLDG